MEPFLASTGIVALAEMGDKTQLLALLLAARYRRPFLILLGILLATFVNHAAAAGLGMVAGELLASEWLKWILAAGFIAIGLWTLVPDEAPSFEPASCSGWSCLAATIGSFFLAEMGDKTQIATVALAAQYSAAVTVAAGSTLGLFAANAPAVLLGNAFARRLPLKLLRWAAAAAFVVSGVLALTA
jgi:Ca2+/H+ antiporter, TMEM165/GDT1 family